MNPVPASVELVVDAANVMGSRPDGWWRDRAAAATRLVQALAVLPGQVLPAPGASSGRSGGPAATGGAGEPRGAGDVHGAGGGGRERSSAEDGAPTGSTGDPDLQVHRVLAVVEGQARQIPQVSGVSLVRAAADGDGAVVSTCRDVLAGGGVPLAVTADRGLRDRLPEGTVVAGPRWLLDALDRHNR